MRLSRNVRASLWIGIVGSAAAFAAEIIPIREVFEPSGTFPKEKFGKVAVVQWAPATSTPLGVTKKEANAFKARLRAELQGYIEEAASNGAEWVVTPEFALVGYPDLPELPPEDDNFQSREDIEPYVEPLEGPSTRAMGALAKRLGIYLNIGFAEEDERTGKYYNTVAALGPDGGILASYRKINLFHNESDFLEPGTKAVTYSTPFGKTGLIICADVYSSKPMDDYERMKVKVLALSTSWAQPNTGMESFVAGAKWVGAHLLAANQNYFPDSGVIDPNGRKQSHIRQTTGIAYGYLPRLRRAR